MPLKFAFAGFRHGHILELLRQARAHPECEVVACSEEDPATRESLKGRVDFTHERHARMFEAVECDVVAVGDYYAARGGLALEALRRGRHVIGDKPLCTRLEELVELGRLAKERGRAVGCQLGQPYHPNFQRLRQLVREGRLGTIHQIAFGGQHPLLYGSRPGWYFEDGKHGGTINDIAIHGIHMLPKVTGLRVARILAARQWNAFAAEAPRFMDSAQFMLELDNGAGLLGDVSYAMPASHGYTLPQYWRFTVFGSKGVAETAPTLDHVAFAEEGVKEVQRLPGLKIEASYLDSFLAEIRGAPDAEGNTTADVLEATRVTLLIQQAAETGARDVAV
ncbi:MAG: Gfo/Idh/MocA family oxidoreductase [Planctomycetota bacterium]|nr:Gfo/Idh/MocA family oxidoreductase [Planctomycetota bacterium]